MKLFAVIMVPFLLYEVFLCIKRIQQKMKGK